MVLLRLFCMVMSLVLEKLNEKHLGLFKKDKAAILAARASFAYPWCMRAASLMSDKIEAWK
jgi:hypothetical protein